MGHDATHITMTTSTFKKNEEIVATKKEYENEMSGMHDKENWRSIGNENWRSKRCSKATQSRYRWGGPK